MTTASNAYETLYSNLKNTFAVVENGRELTLGASMLMRAEKSAESESMLTVTGTITNDTTFGAIVTYVNNKLAISSAPEKVKTLRRFPVRSSISAIFTAVAACALVFSFGIFALTGNSTSPISADASQDEMVEDEIVENNLYESNQ